MPRTDDVTPTTSAKTCVADSRCHIFEPVSQHSYAEPPHETGAWNPLELHIGECPFRRNRSNGGSWMRRDSRAAGSSGLQIPRSEGNHGVSNFRRHIPLGSTSVGSLTGARRTSSGSCPTSNGSNSGSRGNGGRMPLTTSTLAIVGRWCGHCGGCDDREKGLVASRYSVRFPLGR